MIRFIAARRALTRSIASLLFALVAVAALGNAHAQNDRRGFLFEVRKGTQTSLLFGTIHVGRPLRPSTGTAQRPAMPLPSVQSPASSRRSACP